MFDNQNVDSGAKRGNAHKKYILGMLGIFFLVLLILFLAPKAASWYEGWKDVQFQKKVEGVRKEMYDTAMADTYGGKTPQETLQMYIEAVEKGDYELASKYFVEEKREENLNELQALKAKDNLSWLLGVIKLAESYSDGIAEESYEMRTKTDLGPYYYVRFVKYPNGVWKLTDA